MSDQTNKKRRGLEEVSHFFLSHQHCQGREKDFSIDNGDSISASISHDINSTKSNEAFILLDQDKIVSLINPAAKFLLGMHEEELCGQMFNYFIRENETVQVSIFRENRNAGIGEMHMEKTDWEGETAYLISIQDVTDRLRTVEGKIGFASVV